MVIDILVSDYFSAEPRNTVEIELDDVFAVGVVHGFSHLEMLLIALEIDRVFAADVVHSFSYLDIPFRLCWILYSLQRLYMVSLTLKCHRD